MTSDLTTYKCCYKASKESDDDSDDDDSEETINSPNKLSFNTINPIFVTSSVAFSSEVYTTTTINVDGLID